MSDQSSEWKQRHLWLRTRLLTVPSGKMKASLAWLHAIPADSSLHHVRPNWAAQSPGPIPSHFSYFSLCADIFIIKTTLMLERAGTDFGHGISNMCQSIRHKKWIALNTSWIQLWSQTRNVGERWRLKCQVSLFWIWQVKSNLILLFKL